VPPVKAPSLSLSEWIVLSLVCEALTHGNAVAHLVSRDGELGRTWNVHKAAVDGFDRTLLRWRYASASAAG
jgi:hypothetical protein